MTPERADGPRLPGPLITVSVAPRSRADELAMAEALTLMSKEDASLRITTDVESGRTLISGAGEAQLESVLARMKREFQAAVDAGKPRVAYRETIRKSVTEEAKFIRRSAGRGQFGHCILKIEPLARSVGFAFVDAVEPGRLPPEGIAAVEKGAREALDGGALAGFPIVDVKVTLLGGTWHETDSNEMAFKICGAMGVRSGCRKAAPVLLEPIMKFEATTPERCAGDVIGDLKGRRAKVSELGDRGGLKLVGGAVPLSELFGYAQALRSLSQGRASFTMEWSHFEEVPWEIYQASIDPHGPDEPPAASAGRPVLPVKPKPGLSGGKGRPFPPAPDK